MRAVHLRDGPMMELVTPTIRQGGVNTVFVMVSCFAKFKFNWYSY